MRKLYLFKIGAFFGALGGITIILFLLLLHFTDQKALFLTRIPGDAWVPLVSLVFASYFLKKQNRKHNMPFLFGEAFFANTVLMSVLSATAALLLFVLCSWLLPELVTQYKADLNTHFLNIKPELVKQRGAEVFQQQINDIQKITPVSLLKDEFIKKMLYGLFLVPLISFIFRDKSTQIKTL